MKKLLLSFIACIALYSNTYTQIIDTSLWIADGPVYAIASDSANTYIGGKFSYVGLNTGYGVKLTTTSASPDMTFPKVNGVIYEVVPDGQGGWYIGGNFTKVGHYTRNNIAHINSDKTVDTTWNPNVSRSSQYPYVYSIAISGSDIYVGGDFDSIGGQYRKNIAKLNNTTGVADLTWNPNANNDVGSIVISGSSIYVGGWFTNIGGQNRNYIAKLNNITGVADATWNPNANSGVYTIAISGSNIYVGGNFNSIGGQSRNCIAKLNNTTGVADATWNPNAISGVSSIVISGNDIYVGGTFDFIGGQYRKSIAKLNNTTGDADLVWNPSAGGSLNGIVTIAISGSDIYVGGAFKKIGGQNRVCIAKLNNITGAADSLWDPNPSGELISIAISGNDIYAGGSFTSIGGQQRSKIAKIAKTTGTVDVTWNPNTNISGYINSIAISGNDIYVGGYFNNIGGQGRSCIAKLNNTTGAADLTWNPNANNEIYSIVINGSNIYVGGEFTYIGNYIKNHIAKLNNTTGVADPTWNPNANNYVNSIAISESDIYVGGSFTSIGGQNRNHIAKLNNITGAANATWNPNPSGELISIAISGSDIYVGGWFYYIGGLSINYIAKLNNTTGNADSTWNPNANNNIETIVISGSDIYVGGDFTIIGGQNRNRIAKLNNTTGDADSTWNPNANGTVKSIVINGNDIYARGSFTSIGDNFRSCFARIINTFNCNIYVTATSITNESLLGANDGAIETFVNNGTPPYTYNWSNSATTQNISGLSAGYYSVSVTDNNSCSTTATFEVLNEQTIWECNDTMISLFLNPIDTCFDIEPDSGYIYSFTFPSDSTVEITWILLSTTDTSFAGYLTELYQFDTTGCFVALLDIECAKYLKHFSDIIHIYSGISSISEPTHIAEGCKIYPNPANDNITVALQNVNIKNAIAEIYNIQGRLFLSTEIKDQSTNIDVSKYPKGIYLLKLTGDNGVWVEKVVKQ